VLLRRGRSRRGRFFPQRSHFDSSIDFPLALPAVARLIAVMN